MYQATYHATPEAAIKRERLDDVLFEILEAHLTGAKSAGLKITLEMLCEHENGTSAMALYSEAGLSYINQKKLTELLHLSDTANPPKTLLGWIEKLTQENAGYGHLQDFHYFIKKIKTTQDSMSVIKKVALISTLINLSLKCLQALESFIPDLKTKMPGALSTIATTLRELPLIALVTNCCYILNQTYQTIYNDTFMTPAKRFQRWTAGTLRPALSLTAYALCIAQQGISTTLSTAFLITSSLVSVVNSTWNFYHLPPKITDPLKTASEGEKLNYIRQQDRFDRTIKSTVANLSVAVLVSGLAIFLRVFPPTTLLSISIPICMQIINFVKDKIHTYIHTESAKALQINLNAVQASHEKDDNPMDTELDTPDVPYQVSECSTSTFFKPVSPLIAMDMPSEPRFACVSAA